jgi:hypothetical protein
MSAEEMEILIILLLRKTPKNENQRKSWFFYIGY